MTKESELIKIVNINKQNIKNSYHEPSEIQNQINQITIINEYLNKALSNTIEESTRKHIQEIKKYNLKLERLLKHK